MVEPFDSDNEHSDDDYEAQHEPELRMDQMPVAPPSKNQCTKCLKTSLFAIIAAGLLGLFIFQIYMMSATQEGHATDATQ